MDHDRDLSHASPDGLYFLVDLANAVREDPNVSTESLSALVDRHGAPGERLSERDAELLREEAGRLIRLLSLHDVDAAAVHINALMDHYDVRPRLVRPRGRPWSMHVQTRPAADRVQRLLSTGAFALGLWLSERGRCAWGTCSAAGCSRFYIDTGRRSPRRFCSSRHAIRVRVAAHRAG